MGKHLCWCIDLTQQLHYRSHVLTYVVLWISNLDEHRPINVQDTYQQQMQNGLIIIMLTSCQFQSSLYFQQNNGDLVDEIWNEADGFQIMQMISFCSGHVQQYLQILKLLHKNSCISVKEAQSVPLEDEVNVTQTCVTVHLTHLTTNIITSYTSAFTSAFTHILQLHK